MTLRAGLRAAGAALCIAGFTGVQAAPAAAFQLIPIVMEFAPSGRAATQSFGIFNDGDEPVAVEVSMVVREVGLDGAETLPPAADEFLVYPNQALIPPRQVQLIQVRWQGDPDPDRELAFRIIAEQLPVVLDEVVAGGGRIDILLRFEGAVYVTPLGAAPSLAVEEAARIETDTGPRLAVTIVNRGSAHGLLEGATLLVRESGGDPVELHGEELGKLQGANVLAGNRRRFLLPWPAALGDGDLAATLDLGSP